VDNGGGSYTVDMTLIGPPCGITTGGRLFTVDLESVAGDGSGTIAVTSVKVRDCDNGPIGAIARPPAALTIDLATPTAISDLVASQVTSGNGAGSTTGITVTWSTGDPGAADLYRAPFGSYPEYDDGPVTPPDSSLAPGGPWVLVTTGASS